MPYPKSIEIGPGAPNDRTVLAEARRRLLSDRRRTFLLLIVRLARTDSSVVQFPVVDQPRRLVDSLT